MANTIEEFRVELNDEVSLRSLSEEKLPYEAFFELAVQRLEESGEIQSADLAHYQQTGLAIDGYSINNNVDGIETVTLILTDFDSSDTISSLLKSELDTRFKRVTQVLNKSFDEKFKDQMNDSEPAYGLMQEISRNWDSYTQIRILIITNKVLSSRIDRLPGDTFKEKTIIHSVVDLERLFEVSEKGREDMVIDLEEFGGSIPALPGYSPGSEYSSYMTLISGTQLAKIYSRWGDRLLEQNVRVFLQARSKVNRGLRTTLREEPQMFFSYNNGIAATAVGVTTVKTSEGLKIKEIENFQIVNGGQTTGSIFFAASKDTWKDKNGNGIDLDKVFVQMKLSVIDSEKVDEIVPRISQYSNTQNSVNAADFSANHPFYIRIESLSRSTPVPVLPGEIRAHKWFFERARGSYQQNRSTRTPAQMRSFDAEYPKKCYFDKLMLSKCMSVWKDMPHEVSKGAQSIFKIMNSDIQKDWEDSDVHNNTKKNDTKFNDLYYKELVSKVIIFKATEKLISSQPWYQNAYRANFVAYSISKLSYDVDELGCQIDFMKIWDKQDITPELRSALDLYSTEIREVILNPPQNQTQNITQWAKRENCWDRVKKLDIKLSQIDDFDKLFISKEDYINQVQEATSRQSIDTSINQQFLVLTQDLGIWGQFSSWAQEYGFLSEKVESILTKIPQGNVTDRQCEVIIRWVQLLQESGCPYQLDTSKVL
tara:strand:- start:1305 stop:3431 length:2127 start_codon:yes stop_codon:yes gene_type:complete